MKNLCFNDVALPAYLVCVNFPKYRVSSIAESKWVSHRLLCFIGPAYHKSAMGGVGVLVEWLPTIA